MGGPRDGSRCFCCFAHKLSAIDISFSAEILGCRGFGEVKNSETARCSAAVLRCFVIQMLRIAKMALPVDPSLRPILDEIRMSGRYHKLT